MTSTFTVPPAALHDHNHDPRNPSPPADQQRQRPSTTSLDSNHLSPLLSRATSDSVSPSEDQYETPAASTSTLSHYQSSAFSDLDEDPFFGANFSNLQGPESSFLDAQPDWDQSLFSFNSINAFGAPPTGPQQHATDDSMYPLTPDPTASIHTTSPRSDLRAATTRSAAYKPPDSISPHELQKPFQPIHVVSESSQLTPSQSSSCRSSEDGLAPAPLPAAMQAQSPRVTVSVWDRDSNAPSQTVERTFDDTQATVRGGVSSAGDLISSQHEGQTNLDRRDSAGRWERNPMTGQAGLDPMNRPADTIVSIKEASAQRETDERNQDVGKWLTENLDDMSTPQDKTTEELRAIDQPGRDSNDGIPFGDATENQHKGDQTYYTGGGGQMNEQDYEIIAANEKWGNAPMLHQIRGGGARHQPQSSQAAIEKFERMCRDNDSIFSRAATWGTRRRSIHSVADFDVEGVTSGNFLKKLSISRGTEKSNKSSGSLLRDLAGLMRRPSAKKRSRSNSNVSQTQTPYQESEGQHVKRDSTPHLELPSRTSSWGKKPGLNITDAIMSVGHNAASVAATHHARSGSISGGTPLASPRSPRASLSLNLNSLRRPRSKSELPKPSANASIKQTPSLMDLLKRSGGPPVPAMSKANVEVDDDDDEDDGFYDDLDMQTDTNIIDEVTPNLAGFQQHVMALNPGLATTGAYLVDRIAHQQIIRYKHLLTLKVKHLGLGANCPCGTMCIALGGTANVLDQKGDAKGLDPLSSHFDDEDGGTPTEGAVTQESFPPDIPMPPTQYLPAEFECQLCYSHKKFQKPSDWTKHVHEDVQPFTCTWDKCRDPKIFKRKADWVRHENEGHRHLEWWTCDVEDCRHTCYRRDNFLQHLVREHKFTEPKVKTKAAMKKSAGGVEPTWQKVEQCHIETSGRPQDEPCRFCGKSFPTWKKLTVHLAKHMEQISLPVLRLVAAKAKELDPDTIISPVQDPPPRPMFPVQTTPTVAYPGHVHPQAPPYQDPNSFMYMTAPGGHFQPQPYYPQHFDATIDQSLQQAPMGPAAGPMTQGYHPSPNLHDIPVTSASYAQAPNPYMAMGDGGLEPFPQMNALGLQGVPARPMGQQMGYDGMMGPPSGHASPFSGQGSVSPYSMSPHQNRGQQEKGWDERQAPGFR